MFYELVQKDKDPTPFQLQRLRSYELTLRVNSVIYEAFDLGTDIAFMLVLFDQSGRITLPAAWDWFKATTECAASGPSLGDPEFFYGLAVASAVFIAISLSYRLFAAIYTVATKNKEINSLEWLWVIMGTFISMLDPWNGALFINQAMDKKRIDRNDYVLAKSELKSDFMLVMFENVPQLVIQIIYGAYTGDIGLTSVAWYPALFMTLFHMLSQLHEVYYLWRQLPKLRSLAEEDGSRGMPLVAPDGA